MDQPQSATAALQADRRIQLRLIDSRCAPELFRLLESNRDYLRQWHPWVDQVLSVADVENMISAWQAQSAANRGFCAGIWHDGQLCGTINHLNLDWTNRWTALSYWLDAAHQGKGIMTNCCRAMIVHGFKVWKLNRITIECAAENARSRAIPERLGFKLEGMVRAAERLQDHYADHAIYGLLRAECPFANGSIDPNGSDSRQPAVRKKQPAEDAQSFDWSLKLAFEMNNADRVGEAEALCRVLMQLRPENSQLLFLLGMILHKAAKDDEAVKCLSLAAQYEPDSARIFNGLGCVHQKLKDHPSAIRAFERAAQLEAPSASTCYNLGNSYYPLGQIERALASFRKATEINPLDSASWNNSGKCLKELGRLDESMAAYDQAVEIAPDYVLGRYGRAIARLTAGRLEEGFQDYESRPRLTDLRQFTQPVWDGKRAPGKTLFLTAEQGFGDAIQMVRFIAGARERVGRVILECRPELATLFQYSNCADTVIPFGAPIPAFDFHIRLLSLPHALGITLETIPGHTPYLQAPAFEGLPAAPTGHLKVGLAWAGNPGHHQDANRSVHLKALAPILEAPGVTFYSLQPRVPAVDEAYLRSKSAVIRSGLKLDSFLTTASVINELDLVIAVDTAVGHLAGALNKPVWLLLQYSPDWRWFLERVNSPWYPAAQLFRQWERACWDSPVARAAEALRELAVSAASRKHGPRRHLVKEHAHGVGIFAPVSLAK